MWQWWESSSDSWQKTVKMSVKSVNFSGFGQKITQNDHKTAVVAVKIAKIFDHNHDPTLKSTRRFTWVLLVAHS